MRRRKDKKVRSIAMCLAGDLGGVSCKELDTFIEGVSGAAIIMRYSQMNAVLIRNKNLSDKIENLKS